MGMDISQDQRDDLARRIERVRISRFGGNRKAAYTAARVNSNTWTNAEAALPIAERSLIAIVAALWPETHGDWRQLDPPLGGTRDLDDIEAEVRSWKLPAGAEKKILAVLEADRQARGRERGTG